jgi:hypothetical protein
VSHPVLVPVLHCGLPCPVLPPPLLLALQLLTAHRADGAAVDLIYPRAQWARRHTRGPWECTSRSRCRRASMDLGEC